MSATTAQPTLGLDDRIARICRKPIELRIIAAEQRDLSHALISARDRWPVSIAVVAPIGALLACLAACSRSMGRMTQRSLMVGASDANVLPVSPMAGRSHHKPSGKDGRLVSQSRIPRNENPPTPWPDHSNPHGVRAHTPEA